MLFKDGQKVVFIGDSVTDSGRKRPVGDGLWEGTGTGYVRLIESFLNVYYPERLVHIVNMGISGNTSTELLARFDADAVGLTPDFIVICIGFNDVWRYFDCPTFQEQVSLNEYSNNINSMLKKCSDRKINPILMTPYYLESNLIDPMRKKMDEYRSACISIAAQNGVECLDLQKAFDRLLEFRYPAYIAWDRVHPGHTGSMLIAVEFLKFIGFDFKRLDK